MSHLIIAPFDHVFTPANGQFNETWHGLHEPIDGGIAHDGSNIGPVLRPIVETGFKPDFDSEIAADLPEDLREELGSNPITDWKCLLADLRENGQKVIPLHVCKLGYKIHQNADLFKSMIGAADKVLGRDNYEIATVGTLGAYTQFFVSFALKGANESFNVGKLANGANDVWNTFFNLVSSHNSLVASQTMLSTVRIVCMNTVQASIHDSDASGTSATIKHTVNSESLITPETFAQNLETWIAQKDRFVATLAMLREQSMTLDQFRSFAAGVFTQESSDQLSSQSFNRIAEMEPIFAKGFGNAGVSAYDAINAFTQYFTSGNGVGGKNVKTAKKIASANFGRGNDWKREAIRVASTPEVLTETIKRGERLYADKLILNAKAETDRAAKKK